MCRTGNKKGQIFSLDAVISIVVFIIIFVFLIFLWNLYSARLQESIASEEIQLLAFQISDILKKSPGAPTGWEKNPSSASVIGLQLSPGFLSKEKVDAFMSLPYDETKKIFNIERFEFYAELFSHNGTVLNATGLPPGNSSYYATAVSAIVLIENETRQFTFTLWKE